MGKDLVIGPADLSWLEEPIATHLMGLGVERDLEKWLVAGHGETWICLLNNSSVVEFLRHVVRCEGLTAGDNGASK
jgi:hypothetical protein